MLARLGQDSIDALPVTLGEARALSESLPSACSTLGRLGLVTHML